MTPFDPTALLAMLRAFYPIVSVSALQAARRDRPEYFAGGTLFGSKGEKLALPDGRVFDLIYAAGDADPTRRRWQVIEPGPSTGASNGFALEPGPFTPIDEAAWPPPTPGAVFVPLVAGAWADLGDADGLFGQASSTIVAASSPAALDVMFSSTIGPAEHAVDGSRANLNAADPSDIIVASGGQVPAIDAQTADYTEPAPSPIPDPGPPMENPPGSAPDESPPFGT